MPKARLTYLPQLDRMKTVAAHQAGCSPTGCPPKLAAQRPIQLLKPAAVSADTRDFLKARQRFLIERLGVALATPLKGSLQGPSKAPHEVLKGYLMVRGMLD